MREKNCILGTHLWNYEFDINTTYMNEALIYINWRQRCMKSKDKPQTSFSFIISIHLYYVFFQYKQKSKLSILLLFFHVLGEDTNCTDHHVSWPEDTREASNQDFSNSDVEWVSWSVITQCLTKLALGSKFLHLYLGVITYIQVLRNKEVNLTEPYFTLLWEIITGPTS